MILEDLFFTAKFTYKFSFRIKMPFKKIDNRGFIFSLGVFLITY